jgi:hypothetical protein
VLRGVVKSRGYICRSEWAWAYLAILFIELRVLIVIVLRPFIVLLRELVKSWKNICRPEWARTYITIVTVVLRGL